MTKQESERSILLAKPQIRLSGPVDHNMYHDFRSQLEACPSQGPIAISIMTLGGDPEIARSMADDIRLLREADSRKFCSWARLRSIRRERPLWPVFLLRTAF